MNINYIKLNNFIKRFSDEDPFTFKSEWDLIFNPHIKIVSVNYDIKFTIIKLSNKVINIYNSNSPTIFPNINKL